MRRTVKKYNHKKDYDRVMDFLRELYLDKGRQKGWLPQRFEDMEYRVNTLFMEGGAVNWHSCIRLWEEGGNLVGVAVGEDEANLFPCIKAGYEALFIKMLDWKERMLKDKNLSLPKASIPDKPLPQDNILKPNQDLLPEKAFILTVAVTDEQGDNIAELRKRGYCLHKELTYLKAQTVTGNRKVLLPEGYKIITGNETQDAENVIKKYRAVHLGFHPDDEDNPTDKTVRAVSFWIREKAPLFDYKYEVMTQNADGEICSYMYTWVDKKTGTAYIEPLSTRIAHRRKGLAKAMINATINILAKDKIKKCYVNPYNDERNAIYAACGFKTENIEYWYEKELWLFV